MKTMLFESLYLLGWADVFNGVQWNSGLRFFEGCLNPIKSVVIENPQNSDWVAFLCFERPEVSPDSISYKTTIRACENSSRWQFAQWLMAEAAENMEAWQSTMIRPIRPSAIHRAIRGAGRLGALGTVVTEHWEACLKWLVIEGAELFIQMFFCLHTNFRPLWRLLWGTLGWIAFGFIVWFVYCWNRCRGPIRQKKYLQWPWPV